MNHLEGMSLSLSLSHQYKRILSRPVVNICGVRWNNTSLEKNKILVSCVQTEQKQIRKQFFFFAVCRLFFDHFRLV